jgi:hypothetical protein
VSSRTKWLAILTLAVAGGALFGARQSHSVASKLLQPATPTPRATSRQGALLSALDQSPHIAACQDSSCLAGMRAAVAQKSRGSGKLSSALAELSSAQTQAAAGKSISASSLDALPKSLRDMVAARLMRLDSAGRVQVFIETARPIAEVHAALSAAGIPIEREDAQASLIQAWVPISALPGLESIDGIRSVRLPDYGVVQAGSVTTQGDALLKASNVRSTFGVDGTGVRVGVISDGVEGLAASQSSGDLPTVNTATCDVGAGSPTASGAGAEGTAMLEIVHDIAPGAELWFGYFGANVSGTYLDFNAAVNCLAQNVDVVVDDFGFLNAGPYDGTSMVSANTSAALNNGSNPIRAYYNAVGNHAEEHYQEPFADSGFGDQLFQATANTVDLASVGARSDDPILVPADSIVAVYLQWNDPFSASCNDYDLYAWLHDTAIEVGIGGDGPQTCSQHPTELMLLDNTGGLEVLVDITVSKFAGSARTLDMFFVHALPNFLTPCSSVPANSDAGGGVVSLGAIDASDPSTNDIEPYSSCGPTNDGRTKPDAVAIDHVSVTGDGGFGSPFSGTSAAAPHAAGIAALLLQCNSGLTRDGLRNALLNNAVDLGTAGTDNFYGHGRLDALASANAVGCNSPTTPTPTAVAAATPTRTAVPTSAPTQTNTPPLLTATNTPVATNTPQPTNTHTPIQTPTRTPAPGPPGDVNCSHQTDPIDAALLLQFGAGLFQTFPCEQNADVNHDGTVNAVDAALVLQYSAGLIATL